jgi:4-hydroxyproline epimerase
MQKIPFLDSHTGGEPTRLLLSLPFKLSPATVAKQLTRLNRDHDDFRSTCLQEPRGAEVLVGACLVEPADPSCDLGVIFFNNVGYLGMCGHATIGVIASLAYLGRVKPGTIRIETPVGVIEALLHENDINQSYPNRVSVKNVASFRHRTRVAVSVGSQTIHGDIAWGGNWFFLVHDHGLEVNKNNVEELTEFSWQIRQQLTAGNITGEDGAEIDHIELFGPSTKADSRSFVLCPGKAYDRSPCGTGTSAKLACLYADSKLQEGQTWKQQSVVGSIFEGMVTVQNGLVFPTITGEAWVMSRGELLVDERDPFSCGFD